jgi:hypothetical protein
MKIKMIIVGLFTLSSILPAFAAPPKPQAKILSDNGAYHRVYLKEGNANRVFGMDARIGVAGILGGSRPQFLQLHYADGNTIKYARLRRGGKVDVVRRMKTNARELAKVFTGMGRPKLATALHALSKTSPKSGSPYLSTGVSFGGIWKDPGVSMTLPSGDRLYFRLSGEGRLRAHGHQRMRLSYGLARINGANEMHSAVLYGTSNGLVQQRNNAKKLNQALDFLEAKLGPAVQP